MKLVVDPKKYGHYKFVAFHPMLEAARTIVTFDLWHHCPKYIGLKVDLKYWIWENLFLFYFLNLLFYIVEVFSLVTSSQVLSQRKSNQLVISSWEWTNSWVNYLLQGFQKIYTNMRLHFMIKYLIEVEMNIVQPTNVYQLTTWLWIMNLIDPTIWILVT